MFLTIVSTVLLIAERLALLVVFGTMLYFAVGYGRGYLIDRKRRSSGRTSRHSASRAR